MWTQDVLVLQVQAVVNGLMGSHNRVEAFVCLYARMVDKDNLWLVLYALKVTSDTSCSLFCLASLSLCCMLKGLQCVPCPAAYM